MVVVALGGEVADELQGFEVRAWRGVALEEEGAGLEAADEGVARDEGRVGGADVGGVPRGVGGGGDVGGGEGVGAEGEG